MAGLRNCVTAMALTLAVPLSAAADSSITGFLDVLKQVCTTPGFALKQRVAVLNGWRMAGDSERKNLLRALGEADAKGRAALGLIASDEVAEWQEAVAAGVTREIGSPDDDPAGAARILMHPEANGVAVLLRHSGSARFEQTSCELLLAGPTQSVVAELTGYLSLFPMHQSQGARVWSAASSRQGDTGHRIDGRRLVLLMDGDRVKVAVLGLNMQLMKQ